MVGWQLKEMQKHAGKTNHQIGEGTGMSDSEISRIMNDKIDNPFFQTIVDIVMFLGGSVDQMVGIPPSMSSVIQSISMEEDGSFSFELELSPGQLTTIHAKHTVVNGIVIVSFPDSELK
jgi:transcriptional regulator with XRE-family HTH domain